MAEPAAQSFENHARFVPAYHFVTFGILLLNLLWTLYRLVRYPAVETVMATLVACALVLIAFYARTFALAVQDRVIRLEMQMRLRELLPVDLQRRAAELTPRQLIALRFASDQELPDLCRTVLNDKVTEQKAIKKMIKNWKADHLRA